MGLAQLWHQQLERDRTVIDLKARLLLLPLFSFCCPAYKPQAQPFPDDWPEGQSAEGQK